MCESFEVLGSLTIQVQHVFVWRLLRHYVADKTDTNIPRSCGTFTYSEVFCRGLLNDLLAQVLQESEYFHRIATDGRLMKFSAKVQMIGGLHQMHDWPKHGHSCGYHSRVGICGDRVPDGVRLGVRPTLSHNEKPNNVSAARDELGM